MSALLVAGPKCALTDECADGTDKQTDGRQTVTLRFLLDAAIVVITRNVTVK